MRDLASIHSLIPALQARLSSMYSELVKQSKRSFVVDKSNYFLAEMCLSGIQGQMTCDQDLVTVNELLNLFYKYVENCKDPVITNHDVLELFCEQDATLDTFWVPGTIVCEGSVILYQFYGTVTNFAIPDDIGRYPINIGSVVTTLLAEYDANIQFIQVVATFLNLVTLVGIYYWNESFGIYMPANKIADWVISSITVSGVPYRQITYNGPQRGSIRLKFVFA